MKKQVKLKDVAIHSKGKQINGDDLILDGEFDYLNGGVNPSGKWNKFNASPNTVTISEGGNSSGYVNFMSNPFWCGAHCYYLYNLKTEPRYLYYALKSQEVRLMNLRTGSAMPNIKKSVLGDFVFNIDNDKNEQKKITNVLDKLSMMIHLKSKQLSDYDQLIKSQFVEMFGDPKVNPSKWIASPMGDYMDVLTDFSSNGSYKHLDSNVVMYDEPNYALMIRTTDLEKGDFINGVKYINKKAYEILGKSKIYGGEIIMNKIGSAGRIFLMPKLDIPVSLGRNAFLFRFNDNINNIFLYYLLSSEYGRVEIKQKVRGAVTQTITKDGARSVKIIVPPIELQNQFAEFVKQVDKLKFAVKESLDEVQTLFDSLMQKYFG
ncbi:restriction endonuclease subunit S [Mycoplasmatota bacterium WC30]